MSLAPGEHLGPYEVLAPLGSGRIGEVYRARDTRLDRTIALKVLSPELSANPVLRERFEREARAAARLAHPHICTLHDIGQDRGIDFLVMEYLEGETLADRLRKGPLPLEQALRRATEIAEALDAAHRQGIVHRDLKPGNVMLTMSGAKLLDYGLARPREADPGSSASAVITQPLTDLGTILDNYAYVAPEQLQGVEPDGRADLFAFGAMLHEMVTGCRAFDGESPASLIAAILEHEPPPVSTLQPLGPPGLDHVVKTCLAKDRDDRWQSAHDLASALRWLSETRSQAGTPAPWVARRWETREWLTWVLSAIVLAVLAGGGLAWKGVSRETPPVLRASLLPSEGARFLPWLGAMALSPDGTRLAFVGRGEDGTRRLWVRPLDSFAAQPLAGTEKARHPFWSPDGRSIGFFSSGKLRRVDASGGPPLPLCDAPDGRGGTWSADGTVLFTPTGTDVIYSVPASGGTPAAATAFDESRGERSHRFPQFLPDGRHFIFLASAADGSPDSNHGIFAASLDSLESAPIVATRSSARYAATGHLLFVRGRTLVAQPFDPDTLELSGETVPVAQNLSIGGRRDAVFSVSDTGLLVFQRAAASADSRLVWFDRTGRERGTIGRPANYNHPVLSHDQGQIAVEITDPHAQQSDIWVLDIERGTSTRLTVDASSNYWPRWSSDDLKIYFTSDRSGWGDVYSKSSSGAGTAELVYAGERWDLLWSLSPDGTTGWLHSANARSQTGLDIYRVDLGSQKAEVFVQTPFRERAPAISPDGRWVLYSSNQSGRREVFVQSLGDEEGKWQISADGGMFGKWTRDGREIVFCSPDGVLMAVEITLEPAFSAGIPEALFDPGQRINWPQYDVTPDGDRFLVNQPIEQPVVEGLTLVQNWASELER